MNEKNAYVSKIKSKKHFVYRWDHVESGDYYIGKHSGTEDDGYVASGRLFNERYNETEKIGWSRVILGYYPSADAAYYNEGVILGDLYKIDPKCLNLVRGGSRKERELKTGEYCRLVKEKRIGGEKTSIYNWLMNHCIDEYLYLGKTISGRYRWFDTIPLYFKVLCDVAKQESDVKFYRDFINCIVLDSRQPSNFVVSIPEDCMDTVKKYSRKTYDEFCTELARLGEIANERNTKK